MRFGPTPVSEAKAKLAFGWPCQNRLPRVECSTTPRDPKNLSPIVDESRETSRALPDRAVLSVINYANHCGRRPLNESRASVVSWTIFPSVGYEEEKLSQNRRFSNLVHSTPVQGVVEPGASFVAHVDGRARTMIKPSGSATSISIPRNAAACAAQG
jgi:hypothetical protein